MVHSPIQPVCLVGAAHAFEDCNTIPACPPEKARPHRVPRTREQERTLRYAFPIGAGLRLVRLEPGRGEDVGLDDGAGGLLGGS